MHRVEEAQDAKARTQQFMERFSKWYTPGIIALDGQHWPTGQQAQRTYTESGILTRCEHGVVGARCPDCYPTERRGTSLSPEMRERMRADIREAREA